MNFVSPQFFLFYPIILLITYIAPINRRWVILLVGSLLFYAAFSVPYLGLMVFAAFITYKCGQKISSGRPQFMWVAIVSLLVVLAMFKYVIVFAQINLLLPMGISFYSFQCLSYVIDIRRGKTAPAKSFWFFLLYVTFFPQLVAGPIERAENIFPQLEGSLHPTREQLYDGVYYILMGYFRKIVVADYLAIYVDRIYGQTLEATGVLLLTATMLFGLQIYADFSGYSLIAIGSAKLLGINLSVNFDKPYFTTSIREFFRHWHISLNTWFKDYVYIPLGGSRNGLLRNLFAILITFALSGLWHGANLTFVAWGLTLGCLACIETVIKKLTGHTISSHLYLIATTSLAWVFFRATDISQAFLIYKKIFTEFDLSSISTLATGRDLFILLAVLAGLLIIEFMPKLTAAIRDGSGLSFNLMMCLYTALVVIIVVFRCMEIIGGKDASFIYFQF